MTQNILYAYHLCTRGMNAVTFDWRGFGESDAWPAEGQMERDRLCYAEFLTDYAAVLDAIEQRPDVDPARIGLFGYSTGAYLSFSTAADRPEIAAFAGRALLTSFEDILPILRTVMPDRAFQAPEAYPDSLLPIRAAERVRIPVLLIVGEKDVRTPPWMSERIAEKLAGPKEVWIVPGAEHGGANGPEFVDYPAFFVRVAQFFERALAPARE
ncbi:MAG: alpha/beta fold hydrolase [Candidatus Eisenbacteria bacterium]|nr:alpha/beta fold hydrolase [Candidatus Eisenbacteria bacterium]